MTGLTRRLALLVALLATLTAAATTHNPAHDEITNPQLRTATRLAWGVDIGSSIDLTTQDMSTLNADAYVGVRTGIMDVVGIGAGAHAMVNNSSATYPVYVVARTSFRRKPSLVFADLRVGMAFNSMFGQSTNTAFYIAPSVGFNLATGRKFRSYLTVGYSFNGVEHRTDPDMMHKIHHLDMATVRIGIAF
ncbi:MAG: hypothetical protein NC187_10230 [Candidatus Amulumruptor caecigallinarius]|nr:hypothetical protein [Candidatus Amulumruptor caecigallinarius]MCM1397842.1 hypothetical protein [Candidatus Amulumruptor caecigallinarius]MCM1453968.1 hypothetical protein [bacterium]